VRDILHGALELDPGSRATYLDEFCAGDARLRAEVESLLAAAGRPAFFDDATVTVTAALQAGRRIAHYRVIEQIGEGGMGAVYRAIDERLDREVALKVLAGTADRTGGRRFVREAKAASALNHPNIVTIYEFDSHEDLEFIAMEYIQGTTLNALLEERSLPLATMLEYARQAAGAIAQAHQAGIVHRDLKPGNIMVTPEGVVKVLDFGLAKRHSATGESQQTLTAAGMVVGTPAYMSPEQVLGEDEDWRTDIFSFGVILYEIACGRRPFSGKTAQATMYRIVNEEPASPASLNTAVSPALASLIARCLKKNREQRLQSMEEASGALAGMMQHTEQRSPISRRTLVTGGVAGAAAIAAAAVWWPRPDEYAIRYWIEAQRVRNGADDGPPYLPAASDVFESGWKFRLRARAVRGGLFYVINEGPGDVETSRLWVLQPPPGSSAAIDAGREVVTRWFIFDRNPGTEKLWIVWSREPQPAIEASLGEVRDPAQAARIRNLLAGLKAVQPAGWNAADGVALRAAEGVTGNLIELRHR
jgi:predicted Ser/Thr protein kinase